VTTRPVDAANYVRIENFKSISMLVCTHFLLAGKDGGYVLEKKLKKEILLCSILAKFLLLMHNKERGELSNIVLQLVPI
jgi:hypothetical protein